MQWVKRENLFHFLLIFCKLISSSSISSCVVFSSSVFLIVGWNFSLNHSLDFRDIFALNLVFIIWIVWAQNIIHAVAQKHFLSHWSFLLEESLMISFCSLIISRDEWPTLSPTSWWRFYLAENIAIMW